MTTTLSGAALGLAIVATFTVPTLVLAIGALGFAILILAVCFIFGTERRAKRDEAGAA